MGILDKFKKKISIGADRKDEAAAQKDDKQKEAVIKKDVKKSEAKISKKITKEKKVKKAAVAQKPKSGKVISNAHRVLVNPLITEKITDMGVFDKYGFVVAKKANKIEVKKAIQEVYGVKPIAVNMINMKGKKVRSGRVSGKRKDWRKAIVTLKKGEKIEVYEGV
ncbi:50S ribosomal protein L23 [Candidatus Parcubacteria bacterium]|nr:50S ribosomal protein L23 [Candidatus Parcubacteria bacterium]